MCSKKTYTSVKQARRSCNNMHETIRVYWCKEHKGYHTTQERYGKVTSNSRAWNAKARKRRNKGSR